MNSKIKYSLSVFVLILLCLFTLYLFSSFHLDIFKSGNIRNNLENRYKVDYPYITTYYTTSLFGYDVVLSEYNSHLDFKPDSVFDLDNRLSGLDYVRDVVNNISTIPYEEGQNNPNKFERGLDCQGYAILLNRILNDKGITNSIVYTSDHMYNEVIVSNNKYIIDLAKHKFYRI